MPSGAECAEPLLSREPSGFSVYAEQLLLPPELERLARLARYMARAPLRNARVRDGLDGRLLVRTGSREIIAGNEPVGKTPEAINCITPVGAFPTVCVFRPLAGLGMEKEPPSPHAFESLESPAASIVS